MKLHRRAVESEDAKMTPLEPLLFMKTWKQREHAGGKRSKGRRDKSDVDHLHEKGYQMCKELTEK